MSSYLILREISEALRRILWQAFRRDPVLRDLFPTERSITFLNPQEASRDDSLQLSLWLYHVTVNGFLRNQALGPGATEPEHGALTVSQRFPALPLDLFYLITPLARPHDTDLPLMGKTLQVLNDNAIIVVRDPEGSSAEELRVIFNQLTIDELSHLWDALRHPYRLSVGYLVRVTRIDSERVLESARVIDRPEVLSETPAQRRRQRRRQ